MKRTVEQSINFIKSPRIQGAASIEDQFFLDVERLSNPYSESISNKVANILGIGIGGPAHDEPVTEVNSLALTCLVLKHCHVGCSRCLGE